MARGFVIAYPDLVILLFTIIGSMYLAVLGVFIKLAKNKIEAHISREEDFIWKKVDSRFTAVEDRIEGYQQSNLIRHSEVMNRLGSVEAKIPNGRLSNIERMLAKLVPNE